MSHRPDPSPNRRWPAALLCASLGLLAACGKVQEVATEKMIEKSITQEGGR